MMKRNKIVSIVILSVTALACCFVGWLLGKAILDRNAAARERNDNFNRLQKIYADQLFPSDENIERVREHQQELEGWVKSTAQLLREGELPQSTLTPATFKQKLQATVRQLSQHPGIRRGKVVNQGFNFGFDQYLGESDSLPDKDHVERLDKQLNMIEQITRELYAAKVSSLDSIAREAFDSQTAAAPVQEDSGRRGSRRRGTTESAADAAPAASAAANLNIPEGLVNKERFTFEFTATPESFVTALNRLAAMKLFVVVEETSFQKTGDQLRVMDEKPKTTLAAGEVQKAHSQKSYVERMVTNPKNDLPVSVKLVIDVYTFEGLWEQQ